MIEHVWYGTDPAARAGRVALTPLGWIWRGAVGARNRLYDRGVLASLPTALPALSIGNLSAGGTGKTPFASHVAGALRARGARPCIVLRGYGGDEERVHRTLQPDVPVVVDADRARGIATASAQGCDVAILDDAFQHRRVRRLEDVVLVSADVPWVERTLPAGPLREPPGALQRASLIVVTSKAAPVEQANELAGRLERSSGLPVTSVRLRAHALLHARSTDDPVPLAALRGRRVLLVAGIGDPKALLRQIEAAGTIPSTAFFPDHHRYTAADVASLTTRAAGADFVVCTLKDAVKLRTLWPDKAPALMYVSQRVELMSGEGHLQAALDRLLAARALTLSTTAG